MKTKRTAVVAFLLCAIMTIGIGFAAISKNLEINGNANLGMDAEGFSVAFVSGTTSDGDVSEINIATDPTVATFTVNGLKKANQQVVGTFTIKNTSTQMYDAKLANPSVVFGDGVNPYRDYVEVTASAPESNRLSQGDTTTFTVTVTLKEVINDASAQVTFMVLITASSALPGQP